MAREFKYSELVAFLTDKANEQLRFEIESALKSDIELANTIESLKQNLPLLQSLRKERMRNNFITWRSKEMESKSTNFSKKSSFLFAIIGIIFLFVCLLLWNKFMPSTQVIENTRIIDSLNVKRDTSQINNAIESLSIKKVKNNLKPEETINNHGRNENQLFAYQEVQVNEWIENYEFNLLSKNTRGIGDLQWKKIFFLGDSLYHKKNYIEAKYQFEKISSQPEAWQRLAITYLKLGDFEKAIEYCRKYSPLEEDPDDIDWSFWLIYFKAGKAYKAELNDLTNKILSIKDHKYFNKLNTFQNQKN